MDWVSDLWVVPILPWEQSCSTSFKRCEDLILIIVNHDSTQTLLKLFSGKGIPVNQTHAIEEGAVPVYIINHTS